MGNTQSSGSSVEHAQHELTSPTLPQLQLDDDTPYVTPPTGEYHASREARQHIRERLLGSAEEFGYAGTADTPAGLADSIPQCPSNVTPTEATNPVVQPDVDTALHIINQLKRTASPDQLAILHKAILDFTQDGPSATSSPSSHQSPPQDTPRKNAKMIRRRSLFSKPGLASREKRFGNKASPPSKEKQIQTWSPDMFGSSPLSKIAGWESQNNGQAEAARSETPDISPSYLGLEMGSLRITNGTASPAPSVLEKRPCTTESSVDLRPVDLRPDEYWTASEGSGPNSVKEDSESSRPQSSDTDLDHHEIRGTAKLTVVPGIYIHRASQDADSNGITEEARSSGVSSARPSSALNMYSLEASSNPFLVSTDSRGQAEADDDEAGSGQSDSTCLQGDNATSSPSEADSRPIGRGGGDLTNSRAYEESVYSFHEPQALATDERKLRSPSSRSAVRSSILSAQSLSYSNVADTARPLGTRSPRSNQQRPKPDSGYTSFSSISTTEGEYSTGTSTALELDPASATREMQYSESCTTPPIGRRVDIPFSNREVSLVSAAYVSVGSEDTPVSNAVPTTPRKSSLTDVAGEGTMPAISPPTSSTKASPVAKHVARKLQKKRPLSDRYNSAPLIVQSSAPDRDRSGALPTVPKEVAFRHSYRLTQNPGMEHLERTFKSIAHSNSRESLHSNRDLASVPISFPSPSRSPENAHSVDRGRRTGSSKESRSPSGRRFFRSRSRKSSHRYRSSSGSYEDRDLPIGVADFGTVAASLGTSPYDMAMSPAHSSRNERGEIPEARGLTHPYELGVRPKKRVGMDDKEASDFALRRSRDRIEDPDMQDSERLERHRRKVAQQTQLHPRPSQGPRPYSFHSTREPRTSSSSMRSTETNAQAVYTTTSAAAEASGQAYDQHLEASKDPVLGGNNEDEVSRRQADANTADSSEDTQGAFGSWGKPAQIWRKRRQSTGEKLPHSIEQNKTGQSLGQPPWSRQASEESQSLHREPYQARIAPTITATPGHATKTSVIERAAAYGHSVSPAKVPMPGRRAPSPPKNSVRTQGGTIAEDPLLQFSGRY